MGVYLYYQIVPKRKSLRLCGGFSVMMLVD
nr:MAG TPA: hypothetical protein [Caudoviricetes sp.]